MSAAFTIDACSSCIICVESNADPKGSNSNKLLQTDNLQHLYWMRVHLVWSAYRVTQIQRVQFKQTPTNRQPTALTLDACSSCMICVQSNADPKGTIQTNSYKPTTYSTTACLSSSAVCPIQPNSYKLTALELCRVCSIGASKQKTTLQMHDHPLQPTALQLHGHLWQHTANAYSSVTTHGTANARSSVTIHSKCIIIYYNPQHCKCTVICDNTQQMHNHLLQPTALQMHGHLWQHTANA